MARITMLIVAAALVALTAAGHAAAVSSASAVLSDWAGGKLILDEIALSGGGGGDKHARTFRALTKYDVRPTLRQDFVPQLQKVAAEAAAQPGHRGTTFSLSVNDNERFVGYWEWDSFDQFNDYLNRDGTELRNLVSYNNANDVKVTIQKLERAKEERGGGGGGGGHRRHRHHRHHRKEAVSKDDPEPSPPEQPTAVGLLTTYLVKPSSAESLVEQFTDVAKEAREEEGINRYGLYAPTNTNAEYVAYSEFTGEDALNDHLEAAYIRDLEDFLQDEDIVFESNILTPIDQIKPWQ